MLGVVVNPTLTAVDEVYRTVAEEMGVGHPFTKTPVGVFFGRNGSKEPGVDVDDPFFGGVGPRRAGCEEVRRVHHRLPAQRQEHVRQELPVPGGEGRRERCIRRRQRCASGRCARAATRSRPSARAPGGRDADAEFTPPSR